MANPMNRGMGGAQSGGVMQNLVNMVRSFRGMKNPQEAMMQQLGQQNPQAAQQVQQLMQSGQNPKDLAMKLMQQNGVDFNEFMKMMNGG